MKENKEANRPRVKTEFVVKETFKGPKKLSDIFDALVYAEYCRRLKRERENKSGQPCQ
jgi:hypothetical protein